MVVSKISNHTLVKIAAIGGIITVTMGLAARSKLNERIAATDYYKSALRTLRKHPGAVHLLGEPIRDLSIDVGDQKSNYTRDLDAKYEVPVKGSKTRGVLFFWAARKSKYDAWIVNRIELGLKNEDDRRLLILNKDQHTD